MIEHLLGYIVLFPFLGFLSLVLLNKLHSRTMISLIGVGSIGISAVLAIVAGLDYLRNPAEIIQVEIWKWVNSRKSPTAIEVSPTLVTTNAFLAALMFSGSLYQKPINKKLHNPTPSQPR